jgi:hypothetical protein
MEPPTKKAKTTKSATSQIQYWAFTWNADNNESPDSLADVPLLRTYFEERGWRYVFQHERVSRDHYQGRIDVGHDHRLHKGQLIDILSAGGYDTTNFTPSPESNTSLCTNGVSFYCIKADRVNGPWSDPSYTPPRKKKTYAGNDLRCMETPLRWQSFAMAAFNVEADARHICWVYQRAGNAGKSKLQKYMCWKHGSKRVCMGTATQIKTATADAGSYED